MADISSALSTSGGGAEFSGTTGNVVVQMFNLAWERALEAAEKREEYFADAFSVATEAPTAAETDLAFAPAAIEPSVNIPTDAEGANIAKFEEMATATINLLAGKYTDYINTYFPNDCEYLTKAEEWLCEQIENGGFGINPVVEEQIWERERAKALSDARRATQQNIADFAARGFPLPPGPLAHRLAMQQNELANTSASISREQAIKRLDMETENVKFAVGKAIDLYQTATDAASKYIQALSIGPQVGAQLIPSITDSQSKLISAASEYYRARISVEELKLRAKTSDAEMLQQTKFKNGDWTLQLLDARIKAAIAAAQALATESAASLNAMQVQASISRNANDSVGYSYSGGVDDSPVIVTKFD